MSIETTRECVVCSCGHSDHMFILVRDKCADNYVDLALTIHLSPMPFFQRIKKAISYIFGKRSKYGDFDEVLINRNAAIKIVNFFKDTLEDEYFK